MVLKKILKGDTVPLSKHEFLEAITQYLDQKNSLALGDLSKFCICGGKPEVIKHSNNLSVDHVELIDLHQRQVQVWWPT